jgi:hypothetical protein
VEEIKRQRELGEESRVWVEDLLQKDSKWLCKMLLPTFFLIDAGVQPS